MLQSRFKVGEIEVIPFVASRFRLDGGSMFGVVPKVLWEKRAPADGLNRIELSVNSLMVSSLDKKMLVEPGMGSKQDEKLRRIYALEPLDASSALDRLGYSPDDIDIVVPTHLHLDHAGGSTLRGQSQEIRDAFPRAWYIVQELEWEAASDPGPLERGSYDPADYTSLAETGRLSIVMGTTEIAKGVRVELTGGHSRGHQVVRMRSQGEEALYLGDIVPTSAHLKLNWLMAWDLEPQLVYVQKERLLNDAVDRGVTCFFAHDPRVAGCRLRRGGRGSFEMIEDTIIEPV
jgi:glyoxylase-like metal-dependent hydrolase (beta-lactamase superfamily II)